MTSHPTLDVCFVWHMHQPDYRDRANRKIYLPWVRLHALKDYYDMPARLAQFPSIHQTFNLVPSLVEQLEDTVSPEWEEEELQLARTPAQQLTSDQKYRILQNFFLGPEDTLIRPYPRYHSLLRESRLHSHDDLVQHWSDQEWRDLQFWRQLAWIDDLILEQDEGLSDLQRQGQNYAEDQKHMLFERIDHWLVETLNIYRRLQDEGLIELTTTPYYHPILPILLDPESVHESMPECPLPPDLQPHPDDARLHLERALEFHVQRFGSRPRGLWPAEGSVSQLAVELFAELGVEWFATGEDILAATLGRSVRRGGDRGSPGSSELYIPYRTMNGDGPWAVFRDQRLSDLIGFEYSRWEPGQAAHHFVSELHALAENWTDSLPPFIPVILDGENCWEYYHQDGAPFLNALYELLEEDPRINCKTISEALETREARPLGRLSAGSWINGDFHIWMGDQADREAWNLLELTRQLLVRESEQGSHPEDVLAEAWEELYIAEGSDWFWWFGDTNNSSQDSLFDELFRMHLIRIHELLGVPVPARWQTPVDIDAKSLVVVADPRLPAPPEIDGFDSHYYEWCAAARFDPSRHGGAMQATGGTRLEAIYYGVDSEALYLRADPDGTGNGRSFRNWELKITNPVDAHFRFTGKGRGFQIERLLDSETDQWEPVIRPLAVASQKKVFEAMLAWDLMLQDQDGETLSFFLGVADNQGVTEWLPALSALSVAIPDRERPSKLWFP